MLEKCKLFAQTPCSVVLLHTKASGKRLFRRSVSKGKLGDAIILSILKTWEYEKKFRHWAFVKIGQGLA